VLRDFPHESGKVKDYYNVQQDEIVEDMEISVPRICATLDNKEVDFQSHLIEVEGKINDQTISILIDLGASHSYLDPNMVEIFQLPGRKIEKPWMVKLDTRSKIKINEVVNACSMDMNGLSTKEYLNIIPLGSYDCLIGMDLLYQDHVVL
jgi:hypothetical protein